MNQISFFDGTQPFRNNKPIRLIEFYSPGTEAKRSR